MKMIPSPGMAFILEDKRDFAGTSIHIPEHAVKGVGTQGKIIAISPEELADPTMYYEALQRRCPWVNDPNVTDEQQREDLRKFCAAAERGHDKPLDYKVGDHVVFSKFNEQICVYENGKEQIYYSVAIPSILGLLIFDTPAEHA